MHARWQRAIPWKLLTKLFQGTKAAGSLPTKTESSRVGAKAWISVGVGVNRIYNLVSVEERTPNPKCVLPKISQAVLRVKLNMRRNFLTFVDEGHSGRVGNYPFAQGSCCECQRSRCANTALLYINKFHKDGPTLITALLHNRLKKSFFSQWEFGQHNLFVVSGY